MLDETYQLLQSSDEDMRLQTVVNVEIPSTLEDITILVKMLSDKSWRVRKAVVRVLAQVDVKAVVPLLIQALSSGTGGIEHVRFQNSAIECLTLIGQPAIPALKAVLQDPSKDIRISAATALGEIHHYDACDALITALDDEHVNVRYSAVEALSKIPSQKSVVPLTRILEGNEEWLKLPAISALGHIGDYRATPHLIKIAQHPLYLQTAIEALGMIGDERGIPCIIEALGSTDREIRKSAVLSMERMAKKLDRIHSIIQYPSTYRTLFRSACTEQIMHHLIEFTNERDFSLVQAAVKLLGWSGRQEAAYVLLEKFGNEELQEIMVEALIQIGENAIAPLAHAYETTRSLEKQLFIIDCFQQINGKQALQLLLSYLQASPEELLTHALLKAFTRPSFIALVLEEKQTQPNKYFNPLVTQVEQYLKVTHPLVRAEAVCLWGQLLGTNALDDILNATKDTIPAVRVKAIKHLGHFVKDNPDQIEHVIAFLSDDHPNIRRQAVHSLGEIEHPKVFPSMLLVLNDPEPEVRRAAVETLGMYVRQFPEQEYHQQVLDKVAEILETRSRRFEDGFLKIEICNTLQYMISEQSKDLLLQLAHDMDFDVRKAAILTLGVFTAYKTSLIPVLLQFLEDAHWSVREAAVTTLGVLEAKETEDQLLHMLDDPDITVRKALFIALGRLCSVKSVPILVEHLAHDELDFSAYQALTMIAAHARDVVAAHLSNENPKIHLFVQHILEGKPEVI